MVAMNFEGVCKTRFAEAEARMIEDRKNASPWMTVAEAATYLRYSKTQIFTACREDRLRHVQPGGSRGKILFKREWLDAWCAAHEHGGV